MDPQPEHRILRAAIVGAGPAGVITFAALRYAGLPLGDVAVLDKRRPLEAWTEATAAIEQRSMRSESEGHFFPTDFPGFALMESFRRRSLVPLVRSAANRYHPSREDIQQHGHGLARHFGLHDALLPHGVERLRVEAAPEPHLVLLNDGGDAVVRARHVLLALGHGPLRWPSALCVDQHRASLGQSLSHAYQHKTYAPQHYLVVGSGMAAATEWVNVLRAGGTVTSLRRNPGDVHQSLSAPRCYFSSPWLDRYHGMDGAARMRVLRELAHGTYPARPNWERELARARNDGRFRIVIGELVSVERESNSLIARLRTDGGESEVRVDRLTAATGFTPGWQAHALTRHLVSEGLLHVEGTLPVLDDDCSIPSLSEYGTTVALAGSLATWAFPAADSFAGMKYAARRFAERVLDRGMSRPARLPAWVRMVRMHGAAPQAVNELCASP